MDSKGNGLPQRWLGSAIATLATLALLPGTASAATVAHDGTTVRYTAKGGEVNQTAVSPSGGGGLSFTDPGAISLVDGDGPGGCVVSGGIATCPAAGATQVSLRDNADSFFATGNLAALTSLIIDAGNGADTLFTTNGADIVLGGNGDDFIDGQQGNDVVFAGAGNDTMQWDPGDGNDTLEGQGDVDRLRFNGSNGNENVELSANGARLLLTRDLSNIVIDANDVEVVDHRALGGADITTVNDLSGTDVGNVREDLEAFGGGGDAQADQVIVNATNGVDTPTVAPGGGGAQVSGLAARTTVTNAEPASDRLVVNGLGGADQPLARPDVATQAGVLIDGGADSDTVRVPGTAAADNLTATANGALVAVSSDGAGAVNTISEDLVVGMLGGNDSFFATGNLAALTSLTIDAGNGADTLFTTNGADIVIGGDGGDFIDAQQGNDVVFAGAGDDTMQWDPGDGNDTLEGQDHLDRLRFNGSNVGETTELSANGGRLRLTRNVGPVVIDADDVEVVDHRALGGADITTVNDLSGTDVGNVREDLEAFGGGGDAQADQVIVNATNGVDSIAISGSAAAGVNVTGLVPRLTIRNQEPANDQLQVHTLAGTDNVDTSGLAPNSIGLVVD